MCVKKLQRQRNYSGTKSKILWAIDWSRLIKYNNMVFFSQIFLSFHFYKLDQ